MSTEAIWHWAGYGLAAIAGLVAVWGLWLRDGRKKKHARCPKCWYGMEGVPGQVGEARAFVERKKPSTAPVASSMSWTCPECGRVVREARGLHRRRRYWRAVAGAIMLGVTAYGVWTTPRIQASGWVGAVPTTALIAALPSSVPAPDDPLWSSAWRNIVAANRGRFPLYFELYERVEKGELYGWQRRALAEMCLAKIREPLSSERWFARTSGYESRFLDAGYDILLRLAIADSDSVSPAVDRRIRELTRVYVRTHNRWVVDEPLYVEVGIDRWRGSRSTRMTFEPTDKRLKPFTHIERQSGFVGTSTVGWWADELVVASTVPAGLTAIDYHVRVEQSSEDEDTWEPVCSRKVSIPVRSAASVGEILTPMPQRTVGLRFRGEFSDDEPFVSLRGAIDDDDYCDWELELEPDEQVFQSYPDLTVAVAVEVTRNGRLMFTGHAWWRWWVPFKDGDGMVAPMGNMRLKSWCGMEPPLDGCWELHIRADPLLALRNFSSKRYWDGKITMPIGVGIWAPDVDGEWRWKKAP